MRLAVVAGDQTTIARVEGRQALGPRWVSHLLQALAAEMLGDAEFEGLCARAAEAYSRRRHALLDALAGHGIQAHGRSEMNVWVPVREEAPVHRARRTSPPRILSSSLKQFSAPHLAALGILAVLGAASVWGPRRHPGRWITYFSRLLALAIFTAWVGEYVAEGIDGTWSVQSGLPLQLTDAVSAAAIVALLTRRALLVELTYFWALTASLQATLTPDLGQSFPSVYYLTYFTYHVGALVAACLLVFGCRIYPGPLAAWRAFAATLCFAAVAGVGDLITGGNYMYLRSKPAHNSLLSVLGPWPWYIASTAAVGLAMLLVLGLVAQAASGRAAPVDRRAERRYS